MPSEVAACTGPPRDPLEGSRVFIPWEQPDYDLILRVQKSTLISHIKSEQLERSRNSPVAAAKGHEVAEASGQASSSPSDELSSSPGGKSNGTPHRIKEAIEAAGPSVSTGADLPLVQDRVPSSFMCNVLIEDALQQALEMIRLFRLSDAGGRVSQHAKDIAADIAREMLDAQKRQEAGCIKKKKKKRET
jgi:hypothetical protein